MNTMHLIGSEQVQSAGANISRAADTISSAAGTIDEAARRFAGQLETHGYQMEALATAMASLPTLHDYFMMHAPVEPQTWFEPVMPPEPKLLYLDKHTLTDRELKEYDYFHEFFPCVKPEEIVSEKVRNYAVGAIDAKKAQAAWHSEAHKQRLIQWPAAWATAMMKAREA